MRPTRYRPQLRSTALWSDEIEGRPTICKRPCSLSARCQHRTRSFTSRFAPARVPTSHHGGFRRCTLIVHVSSWPRSWRSACRPARPGPTAAAPVARIRPAIPPPTPARVLARIAANHVRRPATAPPRTATPRAAAPSSAAKKIAAAMMPAAAKSAVRASVVILMLAPRQTAAAATAGSSATGSRAGAPARRKPTSPTRNSRPA